MPRISDKDRAERDARELNAWEPMRAAGEALQRERRSQEAAKRREDGVVETAKEERSRVLRPRI
ncbi:hypothetical protein [Paracraurococcus lichenis]|uniref:Uncharacterized protein n=1 Tax=Paracraurococcus lichenis TaxID=3064888 RepID=A0ABT9E9C4_9PROT|nr:hypothetical protein [Paracraurococcus sp. LOR1-02]MDO9712806.1 hypothetical protein [Paracraurococcus sp. LOR1-02]